MYSCPLCDHKEIDVNVHESAAGFYIGAFCFKCGPLERFTQYYKTKEEAQKDLHKIKGLTQSPFWQDIGDNDE